MLKKLTLLALAVTALAAYAVPTAAQSEPIVTDSEGNEATTITVEGTEVTFSTAGGTFECGTHKLSMSRSGQNPSHYVGVGTALGNPKTTPHEGPCVTSVGLSVHIDSMVGTIEFDGSGVASANVEYTYTITTPFGSPHCTFKATNVPITYMPTTSTISISDGALGGTGAGCATSGKLTGVFHVLDHEKKATSIH